MINIISKRYWFFLISAIVIVPGIISLIAFGLKPSTDFQPGSTVTISFQPQVDGERFASGHDRCRLPGHHDPAGLLRFAGDYFITLPQITSAQETTLMTDLGTSLKSTPTPSDFTTTSAAVA